MTSNTYYKIFIQARMSSRRLPGKVLLPLKGRPVIDHVLRSINRKKAVVLTSSEPSDDLLATWLTDNNILHFRGSLDDVLGRFCDAIDLYKPTWVVRVCADSPLISSELVSGMLDLIDPKVDIVTNVLERTFPKGQSVEIVRAGILKDLNKHDLCSEDREHVTRFIYKNPSLFKIKHITIEPPLSYENHALDTSEDYDRINSRDTESTYLLPDRSSWIINEC
ncbi:cytidylyltransferase domain-containing protein [Thalassospira tepidiphila]|uniref:cytidylyltransferase domain-containing protein n=1 Tax=Thalassospira tepidiphila TaxID=393657 RepID=UPI003AA7B446